VNKEILKRERFIWLDIVRSVEGIIDSVKDLWKKERKVPHVVYSWPSERLKTVGGKEVTHLVTFLVPKGMSSHEAAVVSTKHTKAYAILVIERIDDSLRMTLESFHGTKCWKFPIVRHGDVEVLEKGTASEDTETFGILWRRSIAQN